MKSLLTLLDHHIALNPEVSAQISSRLHKMTCRKGSVLINPGDMSDKIYFVEKGILREFYLSEEDTTKEHTTQIVGENTFYYSTLSYLDGIPADTVTEAVENGTLIILKREDLEYLCSLSHQIEHFLRLMLEQTLIRAEKRARILRLRKSEDRLLAFERLHPELQNRVLQSTIASFLDISPQNLSKVRRERNKK